MSAILCGKRSNFFEDLQSSSPSSSSAAAASCTSSPPVSKRIRCSSASYSPPRSFIYSSAHNLFSGYSNNSLSVPPIDHLVFLFPEMDKQLLEKALDECGNDLDSAIRSLNKLRLGSAENSGLANGQLDANHETNKHLINQGAIAPNAESAATEDSPQSKELPIHSEEWVELFVREMMSASNIDDAKTRASRALEFFEKSIRIQATKVASQSLQQENALLKQQLETLVQDNNVLKRAISIQHERQKEFEERGQELHNLKQLVAQYQEQLRTLEVNNYALAMHLKQAQQSNSIPGRFHPDVF